MTNHGSFPYAEITGVGTARAEIARDFWNGSENGKRFGIVMDYFLVGSENGWFFPGERACRMCLRIRWKCLVT